MYNHNDHYLKFYILRSIVLTIQNVWRLDFYKYLMKTLLQRQKRLLGFQNKQLFGFNDNQLSTTKNTFWFDE